MFGEMGSDQFANLAFPIMIFGWAVYGYITYVKTPHEDCGKFPIYWNWAGIFICVTYAILAILENV